MIAASGGSTKQLTPQLMPANDTDVGEYHDVNRTHWSEAGYTRPVKSGRKLRKLSETSARCAQKRCKAEAPAAGASALGKLALGELFDHLQ